MEVEYNILGRKYKCLSIEERGQIQAYREVGLSVSEIARDFDLCLQQAETEVVSGNYFAPIADRKRDKIFSHKYLYVYKKASSGIQKVPGAQRK